MQHDPVIAGAARYHRPVRPTPEHNRATLVAYLRARRGELAKLAPKTIRSEAETSSLTQWIEFLEGLTIAAPMAPS